MRIRVSRKLDTSLQKIKKTDPKLFRRITKQLALFESNPKHHSLRVHKLSGKIANLRSISITKSIRMTYIHMDKDIAYFIQIGTHDQVYKE